jgi:hypothetical protein
MSISTSTKATGIIYRAYNKISNKSYIGQSKNDIKTRKQQHYSKAREKNCTYKFVNALRLYPEDSWVWEVLIEVGIDKLNDYEKFFIQDLDTLNNGYNSTLDKYKAGKKYTTTIYELYHDDYGLVSGTIDDFRLIDIGLATKLRSLKNETQKSCKGWRLLKNKEYEPPTDIVTLIHYEHGTHTLTRKEFTNNFGLHYKDISALTRKVIKCCKGWVLTENKDQCNEIWNIITLTHPVEGTFTLPATEFIRRFGLDTTSISQLRKGKRKSYKNWTLVKEENQ